MIIYRYALIFYLLVFAASALAANKVISRIVLVGNEKTRDYVILREMTSRIGQPVDENKIEVDKNRLMNLNLFNRVEIQQLEMEKGIVLIVVVTERWYIFPFPILFLNEKDWDKISYGAGLIHQNFRGANMQLMGQGWLGFNPGLYTSFANPWIGEKEHFFLKAQLFSHNMKSKSLQYDRFNQLYQGGLLTFGKNWNYRTYLSLTAAYRRLSVGEPYAETTVSNTGVDHLPSLGLSFRFDTRDFYFYPQKGMRLDLYYTHTGFGKSVNYAKMGYDLRLYLPLYKKLILAARSAADVGRRHIPVYGKTFLGYDERIRGYFDVRREGDSRAMAGLELRFPILPVRYFSFGDDSPLGAYARNLPFGISGGIFYDAGATWLQGQEVDHSTILRGYGFGLHIHLPYIYVLRAEYAFNREGHSEVIFDIGVYF